jgi:ribosome-associated heat shock protein Hsp15
MTGDGQRLDKWLWYARFFKSRSLATKLCQSGKVRINGAVTKKAHHVIRIDDVLTFPKERDIRVIKVLDPGLRRGPASEAQTLYQDLEPPQSRASKQQAGPQDKPARREPGAGRPTKADRRAIDRLKAWFGFGGEKS